MELVNVAAFRSLLESEGFSEDGLETIFGCLFQASSMSGILRPAELVEPEVMEGQALELEAVRHEAANTGSMEDESIRLQDTKPYSPANLLESLYQAGLENGVLEEGKSGTSSVCDRCYRLHRKCDRNGVVPCSECRLRETLCTTTRRERVKSTKVCFRFLVDSVRSPENREKRNWMRILCMSFVHVRVEQ